MFLSRTSVLFSLKSRLCGVGKFTTSSWLSSVVSFLVVLSAVGCGGGTTGTSPTDSLKFSGYAEQSDGTRAESLTMTVRAGSTDEPLVNSGTDTQGNFQMDLPGTEEAFVVDVDGIGSASVTRDQSGDGAMTAKLSVTSKGSLEVSSFFESQVMEATLCEGLSIRGTTLVISGKIEQGACPLTIAVASEQLAVTRFEGQLLATCNGSFTTVAQSMASPDGRIDLDLNAALSRDCNDLSIVVSTPQAPDLKNVFQVVFE
jgi:hypothetical protein